MLFEATLRGLTLHHLEAINCYPLGESSERDGQILDAVGASVAGLPWVTGLPVRLVLASAGFLVWMRTRSGLNRLDSMQRDREVQALRRLPLVPLADKLILNLTYLQALGAHPAAGETAP
jgi:hypothetical protein